MELTGGRRRPKTMMTSRETNPDRAKPQYMQRPRPSPTTTTVLCGKVQIIYYLSRNGQLEHPHFMKLPLLPSHHIRLKDVMDRLTVLRGSGMPSLYSWSCKRRYKNGYVWNDLSENDVIYPADGAEYVLKGSRIIPGLSERFQQLQVGERRPPGPLLITQRTRDDEVMEYDEEDNAKVAGHVAVSRNKGGASGGGGYNPSRCNHGGSLDVRPPDKTQEYNPTEIPLDDASPPSSSSSEMVAAAVDRRYEDECNSEAEPAMQGRNSVFMQLIACGSMAVKGRSTPPSGVLKGGDGGGGSTPCGRPIDGSLRKSGSLYKGVVNRTAAVEEYFSGSIVETPSTDSIQAPPEPVLKKSSSYNEERSSKLGIGEEEKEGGNCIPVRKRTSCKQQEQLCKR